MFAGTISLQRTPILTATLPTNTTYQVEASLNGGAWEPTGVLIAGTGMPIAVRLDGLSASMAYRFSRVGGADLITPTVTNGWHVGGSFPNAKEVRIETSFTLTTNDWKHFAFAVPDSTGSFVRAWRAPWTSPTFFRALQPAAPLERVSLSSYLAGADGASGFGIVADDMPQLYRDGFICAPCPAFYHRDGKNAAAAGECYELAGPFGTVTVMVGDINFVPYPGTCDSGRMHFDIGEPAFAALFGTQAGLGMATCRLVPAPVEGNLKMVVVLSSAPYYVELRPYNHRAGVSKVEIQNAGSGTWFELPRSDYNSFIFNGGILSFPVKVRITSRFGEVVEFPSITNMLAGERFTANAQFTNFPSQSPAPIWIQPPVYTDSLSNMLGSIWTASGYNVTTIDPNHAVTVYEGTACLRIAGMGAFGSVNFSYPHAFPNEADGFLEFAIRSGGAVPVENVTMSFTGYDGDGNFVESVPVTLPTIGTSWKVMRIPLAPALAPERLIQFRIQNNSAASIDSLLLDSIGFRNLH